MHLVPHCMSTDTILSHLIFLHFLIKKMHSFTASMLNTVLEFQLAIASIQLYICLVLKRVCSPRRACVEIIWPTMPAIKRTQYITVPWQCCCTRPASEAFSLLMRLRVTLKTPSDTSHRKPNHSIFCTGTQLHFSYATLKPKQSRSFLIR